MNAVISKTAHRLFPISLNLFNDQGRLVHSFYAQTVPEARREAQAWKVREIVETPPVSGDDSPR